MVIETCRIRIKEFERKDAEALYRIVREKDILRFMGDWAEGKTAPADYYGYIDWQQAHGGITDLGTNKRYAVALRGTDTLIGMVGVGPEETLNEIEVAYFMAERHQRKGYTKEAVNTLVEWYFSISEVPYLILTIDIANTASCRVAESCGFTLFEKRTPIGHKQANMESDSYFYYRRYR